MGRNLPKEVLAENEILFVDVCIHVVAGEDVEDLIPQLRRLEGYGSERSGEEEEDQWEVERLGSAEPQLFSKITFHFPTFLFAIAPRLFRSSSLSLQLPE